MAKIMDGPVLIIQRLMYRTTEKLRKSAFWLIDHLKNNKIGDHLNDIYVILENPEKTNVVNRQNLYLNKILSHASGSVPYYKNYHRPLNQIQDFPVINKTTIKNSFNSFISNKYKKEKLIPVITSGSTGTPFKVLHDHNKRCRNSADIIYFGKMAGYELGHRLYYLKIWNEINRKRWVELKSQNIVPKNVLNLSEKYLEKLVEQLIRDKSSKGLLGYASAFDAIITFIEKNNYNTLPSNIKSVIAISEALDKNTRDKLSRYFGVPAVSRYSNVENGMIAQQSTQTQNEFFINWASYFIEILNTDNDDPVPDGQPGRIVVTDLFNYGMPMIRYDTGDIGVIEAMETENKKFKVLSRIEGRRMDLIYNTRGDLVSSFTITNNMWKYQEIIQYQFIQLGNKQYKFKINMNKPFEREEELIQEFKGYFGQDAEIKVEYVKEIPLLASGKRKKVMNVS